MKCLNFILNFSFILFTEKEVNQLYVKPLYRPKCSMGSVLSSGFLSMKRLRVLLLPPEWDASPSWGYPAYLLVPFVHLGAEKHCEIKVSRLRTQQSFKKTPTGRRQSSWLYTKCSQGVELGVTENKYCEKPGGGPSKRSNHSATLPPSIHVLFPTVFALF